MNKWIYLISSCIFIFLLVVTFPVVKENQSTSNIVIFAILVIGFLASLYLFYKKSTYKTAEEKSLERFTPVSE